MKIVRPEVSQKTILEAANVIAQQVNGSAEDIADCYRDHIDGYELAKKLENEYCWDITVEMIESLDCIHYEVEKRHDEILEKWIVDSDIKPPFENETVIKQGVIKGVYEHKPAYFKVKENGCTDESRHLLIKFEDAALA